MAVFMYDFTAYLPAMRCLVPGCDDQTNPEYDASFANFSLPWDGDAISECYRYVRKNISSPDSCVPGDFQQEKTEICSSWVYDHSLIESSAVEDFEMLPVCEPGATELFSRKPVTQTVYMAGMLIGSFLFGWLSDKIGRKATMLIALTILAIGGSFPFFLDPAPDLYYALVISRFISGLGHVGTFMTTFSLSFEYVGASHRTLFGILIETPFAIGGLIVGLEMT